MEIGAKGRRSFLFSHIYGGRPFTQRFLALTTITERLSPIAYRDQVQYVGRTPHE